MEIQVTTISKRSKSKPIDISSPRILMVVFIALTLNKFFEKLIRGRWIYGRLQAKSSLPYRKRYPTPIDLTLNKKTLEMARVSIKTRI